MIKRREPIRISNEQDFINGSDLVKISSIENIEKNVPNPKEPRKFKSHTLPLNEYEYNLLCELAEKYGQTHSGIIRFALKELNDKK